MKFFSFMAALVLAGSMALAANSSSKKVKKVIYEDGSTSTTFVTPSKKSDNTRVFRRISAIAGLNIADTTVKSDGTRTGFVAGAMVDLLGQSNWVLETGLMYRQQGTSGSGIAYNLNYISLPISAKYYFSEQNATGFFAKAGAITGINVAASATANGQTQDIGKGINTFDLGFVVGAGGKFAVSPSASILMEVDYMRGLTNIINYQDPQQTAYSVNNIGITFMSGVAFEL